MKKVIFSTLALCACTLFAVGCSETPEDIKLTESAEFTADENAAFYLDGLDVRFYGGTAIFPIDYKAATYTLDVVTNAEWTISVPGYDPATSFYSVERSGNSVIVEVDRNRNDIELPARMFYFSITIGDDIYNFVFTQSGDEHEQIGFFWEGVELFLWGKTAILPIEYMAATYTIDVTSGDRWEIDLGEFYDPETDFYTVVRSGNSIIVEVEESPLPYRSRARNFHFSVIIGEAKYEFTFAQSGNPSVQAGALSAVEAADNNFYFDGKLLNFWGETAILDIKYTAATYTVRVESNDTWNLILPPGYDPTTSYYRITRSGNNVIVDVNTSTLPYGQVRNFYFSISIGEDNYNFLFAQAGNPLIG